MWLPIWAPLTRVTPSPQKMFRKVFRKGTEPSEEVNRSVEKAEESSKVKRSLLPALLLGSAMVARGEIGLLIIEIGYNSTSYVTKEGFITGVWAILLNTIIGPIVVGVLVKFYGARIGEGDWGLQGPPMPHAQHESHETREAAV